MTDRRLNHELRVEHSKLLDAACYDQDEQVPFFTTWYLALHQEMGRRLARGPVEECVCADHWTSRGL